MIQRLLRWLLVWLTVKWAPRQVVDRDGDIYLVRWTVFATNPSKDSWRIFLHRFARGDDAVELHNHPWKWAYSLILVGGYREERRVDGDQIVTRNVKPWMVNRLEADTFHRVDLLNGECWSLIATGPVTQSWGFWDRNTHEYTPWREFLAHKGQQ